MFRAVLIALACLLTAATATAETAVFELPAVLGTLTHTLPVSDVIIDTAVVGLDCEAQGAWFRCERDGATFWEPAHWYVRLDAELAGLATVGFWQPLEGAHSHSFYLVTAAQGGVPLHDGQVTLTLTALLDGVVTTPDIDCRLSTTGTLGLVPTLRFYVEYHTSLPVEGTRWGTLKARYL